MTARQLHRVRPLWPVDEVSPDGAPAWTIGAPCKYDPDLWFSDNDEDIAAAKAICTGVCPLERRIACMDYAFDKGIEYGVFGGIGREERVEKQCSRCEQVKLIVEFAVDITRADGRTLSCRECISATRKPQHRPRRTRRPGVKTPRAYGAVRVAGLKAARQQRTAATNDRVALYARLWLDQEMPRAEVMDQLGIKSERTAQRYEAQIREQKQQEEVAA